MVEHNKCDIGIITVISVELDAALKALGIDKVGDRKKNSDGTIYWFGEIYSNLTKRNFKIVLTGIGSPGNYDSAAASMDLVCTYSPKLVILVGIAAGIEGKLKIGNVAISERLIGYESASIEENEEISRPEIARITHSLQQDLNCYSSLDKVRLLEAFKKIGEIPEPNDEESKNFFNKNVAKEISAGPSTIASGEKLLRDPKKLITIRNEIHGKTEACEMEAMGLQHTCWRKNIGWLVFRGISDFGDNLKDDRFHQFASLAATTVMVDFIQNALDLNYNEGISEKKNLTIPPPKVELIGREDDIKKLNEMLKESNIPVLLRGIGGIGKSDLCRNLFWNNFDNSSFEYLGWIDHIGSLKASFVNQFEPEELIFGENEADEIKFRKLISFLNKLKSCLLIIDNLVQDEFFRVVRSLPFKVLINSRESLQDFTIYNLDFLDIENCQNLFYKYFTYEKDSDNLIQLINLAGRHTLTIELLAKTADSSGLTIKELLELLITKGFNLSETIKETVSTTWDKEGENKPFFEHLKKVFEISNLNDQENNLLRNLSILPSILIDKRDIKQWLKIESLDILNSLVKKGWLSTKVDNFSVVMHQIIQEVIQDQLKPDPSNCSILLESISNLLYFEAHENGAKKRVYIPFAESIINFLKKTEQDKDKNILNIINRTAKIFETVGEYQKCYDYLKSSVDINKNLYGEYSEEVAAGYNNLSLALQNLGKYKEGLNLQLQALKIFEENSPKNSSDFGAIYGMVAQSYFKMKNFEKAYEFQKMAMQILEQASISLNSKVIDAQLATAYDNHGLMMQQELDTITDHKKAQAYIENALGLHLLALKIREAVLEDKYHTDLGSSFNNLGTLYLKMGDLDLTEEYFNKSHGVLEYNFPDGHPDYGTLFHNIALINYHNKKISEAIDYELKSIEVTIRYLGYLHPDLILAYEQLIEFYKYQEDSTSADIYKRKMEDLIKALEQ